VQNPQHAFHVQATLHAVVEQGKAGLEVPPALEDAGWIEGRLFAGLHARHDHELTVVVLADMGVRQVGQNDRQDAVDVHGAVSLEKWASGKQTVDGELEGAVSPARVTQLGTHTKANLFSFVGERMP
jgi:hypothetical protein